MRPQALWSQLYACSHLLASTPPGLPFQGTSPLTYYSPLTVCLSPHRGGEEKRRSSFTSRRAAQRLAFTYKGEEVSPCPVGAAAPLDNMLKSTML